LPYKHLELTVSNGCSEHIIGVKKPERNNEFSRCLYRQNPLYFGGLQFPFFVSVTCVSIIVFLYQYINVLIFNTLCIYN
jgi:hypothetical protein